MIKAIILIISFLLVALFVKKCYPYESFINILIRTGIFFTFLCGIFALISIILI